MSFTRDLDDCRWIQTPEMSEADRRAISYNSSEGFMDPNPRDLDHCRIPLEDITQATNNFAQENIIGKDYEMTVYKGELSGKKLAFILFNGGYCMSIDRVVKLSSLPEHQNVVSFVGCCYEDGKNILVFEHPTRGSLDKYVSSNAHLTWLMRLQICIDIASGVHYLSENLSDMGTAYLDSASIYLDENWQAKIELIKPAEMIDREIASGCAPSFSATVRPSSYSTSDIEAQKIHSFGEILFELLCGRFEVTEDEGERYLSNLARRHYEKGTLIEIIDPVLRGQMNNDSFVVFSEFAYACLARNQNMPGLEEELQKVLRLQQGFETSEFQQVENIQHMKIPLEEIRSATLEEIRSATRDMTIPHKPGKVYKADLSHFNVDKYVAENKIRRVSMEEILKYRRIKRTVAIKSIDGGYGQRTEEQLQTLLYLSHKNLVKLVGFCDDDDERIHVVYEYVSKGSLDEYIHRQHINYQKYYITNPTRMRNIFPWVIRLQFCLDAARGLNFLHDGSGKNDTIIHGNIKSSNILISRDGVGMIGDFGLSTNQYSDTHRLTKEYDVCSFGRVLFEVLSGVLTPSKISKDDPKFLPGIVKRGFNERDLNDIIDPMLKIEFDTYRASLIGDRSAESLNIFVNIACRCFHEEEDPPTMADIVKELEKAYRIHGCRSCSRYPLSTQQQIRLIR